MFSGELFKFLEATAEAAFATTQAGEICSWNCAAEQLFGYSATEALHKTCDELLKGRGSLGTQVCPAHCRLAATGEPIQNFDMEIKARDGRRIWVSVSTLVFEDSRTGRHLIVHLTHDMTPRVKIEELARKMQRLSKQFLSIPEVP